MPANVIPFRYTLRDDQLPKQWYNLRAHLPEKPAGLRLPDGSEARFSNLQPILCDALIRQEFDTETPWVHIPSGVQNMYKLYRPTPLCRARHLEEELGTPARIYYKFEGNSTSGSHKLNSAVAQAYYGKEQGITTLATETGSGQWGTALSEAAAHYGLDCNVFMVRSSYDRKPARRSIMQTFGSTVTASPSNATNAGRHALSVDPFAPGSLGTAISEAVETALNVPENKGRYQLGSVLNEVMLHQSIIGLEAYAVMEELEEYPDVIIGCVGGGSNFGGLISPFVRDKLQGRHTETRFVAAEPTAVPTLTRGRFAYDYVDAGHICPLCKMYTLGADFVPNPLHVSGLAFHGMNPVVSQLYHEGLVEAVAIEQLEAFQSATLFSKLETILPAAESSYAVHAAIQEAKACIETGQRKTILFCLTGTGYFDMEAYEMFNHGSMVNHVPTEEELQASFAGIPALPGIQQAGGLPL
ncbi:MAG: TrpB-like pyridoxal phosphate-dependent enzyme [Coriobacteriia bacterium]|nr:TrpB-like pyridoxal phosphate-dependent enzyme [Coriobacteriia bacterium]